MLNPLSVSESYTRCRMAREGRDWKRAVDAYGELLKNPGLPDRLKAQVFFDLGEISHELNSPDSAERLYTRAMFADPLYPPPRMRLAETYLDKAPQNILVSVAIPTYQRCADLMRCIDSLRRNSVFRLEIVVVCDPCNDGTLEYLSTQAGCSDMAITVNADRKGAAASLSQALQQARGDYICFINDDVEATPAWDLFVVHTLASFPEAGCGAPLVLYPSGGIQSPGQYNTHRSLEHDWIGKVPFVNTFPAIGKKISDFPALQIPRPCDYGYFMMFTRQCLNRIGYVDESFRRYYIDPDFGYRVQQAGYQNIYCPQSALIHHELSRKNPEEFEKTFKLDVVRFTDKWTLYQ